MSRARIFVENSLREQCDWVPGQPPRHSGTRRLGACLEQDESGERLLHRFADGDDLLTNAPVAVPATVVTRARQLLAEAPPGLDAPARAALADLADSGDVTVTWGLFRQSVLAGTVARPVRDERLVATVELGGAAGSEVAWWTFGAELPINLAAVRSARDRLLRRESLPQLDGPPPGCAVVLGAGRAGAFFHELVGHPMEADVVASGSSFLAGLCGRQIAPGWLSVVDSPTAGGGAGAPDTGGPRQHLTMRVDDEGTPCRGTALIRRGVLGSPMTDLASARLCGWPASGHGRRLDYREPAIPRMTHTAAYAERSTPAEQPRGRWIAPFGVRLVMMNIRTGEFVFHAPNALLYDDDRVVGRLPTIALTGQALTVFAALRPVGHRVREQARATRGCGKLGQFPLLVTFANSAVLLPPGCVDLRVVHDA